MSRPPLIHVGYQKTASTYLQDNVFSNDEVFYAPWGTQSALAIEHFVLAHPSRYEVEQVRDALSVSDGRTPVVSHEDLLGYPVFGRYYPETALQRIAAAFPDARILVCIREQNSMILSNYFQYIRQGGTLDLAEMLTAYKDRPGFRPIMRLDHFEYDLTYAITKKYFDPKQVLFCPIELLKDGDRFLQSIADFLDIKRPEVSAQKVANKRSSDIGLSVERSLNRLLPNPAIRPANYGDYPLRVRARKRIVRLVDKYAGNINFGRSEGERLKALVDDYVGDYYAGSNDRLATITGLNLSAMGYNTQLSS